MVKACAYFCEKALGMLLKPQSSPSSSSPVEVLEPFLSIIFSLPLPASSDPAYLSKRLSLAAGCIKELHAHAPASCAPFVQAASLLCSHSSDIVRSAVAELLSALASCCSFDRSSASSSSTSSLSSLASQQPVTLTLVSWVSSFYTSFIASLVQSISSSALAPSSIATPELLFLKSTISSCSFAHPAMTCFVPDIVNVLLLMFEDAHSSSSGASSSSSNMTPPGRLLCALSELPLPPGILAAAVDAASTKARHTSRHVRIASAGFCCLLSSNMMTTLTQQQHATLLSVPQGLLCDPHPDVRAAAQTALLRMLRAPQLLPHIAQVRRSSSTFGSHRVCSIFQLRLQVTIRLLLPACSRIRSHGNGP